MYQPTGFFYIVNQHQNKAEIHSFCTVFDWLVGWLVGLIYGLSTFVGYLTQIHFYVNDQFYFKQFTLAWVHISIVKSISISNNSVNSNSFE